MSPTTPSTFARSSGSDEGSVHELPDRIGTDPADLAGEVNLSQLYISEAIDYSSMQIF